MNHENQSDSRHSTREDAVSEPASSRRGGYSRRANLILVVVSVLLSLAILEIGTRLLLPPLDDEEMNVFDAEIGKTLRPGYKGTSLGVEIEINSHGLRSPETTLEKPVGTYRILVLGDSWTFGVGVVQDETYPAQLEGILRQRFPGRDIEVINAGVSGYETFNESIWFERCGYKFEPDVTVIGYYPVNDIHDKKSKYEGHARERADHPLWYSVHNFPEKHLRSYQYADFLRSRIKDKFESWRYSRPTYDAGPEELDERYDVEWTSLYREDFKGWLTTKESLGRIARLAAEIECRVILAVFPDLRSLKHYRASLRQQFYPKLAQAALDLGIEVVDMAPCLYPYDGKEDRISLFETKGSTHPNSKGHRLLAERLADHLSAEM